MIFNFTSKNICFYFSRKTCKLVTTDERVNGHLSWLAGILKLALCPFWWCFILFWSSDDIQLSSFDSYTLKAHYYLSFMDFWPLYYWVTNVEELALWIEIELFGLSAPFQSNMKPRFDSLLLRHTDFSSHLLPFTQHPPKDSEIDFSSRPF